MTIVQTLHQTQKVTADETHKEDRSLSSGHEKWGQMFVQYICDCAHCLGLAVWGKSQ